MKGFFKGFIILVLAGCQVPSKSAFYGDGGRTAYNMVIQATNAQEMLLNLVRMRYFDPPFFLEMGNVTTQFTYRSTTSGKVTIPGSFSTTTPFVLGGDFTWQNQPTLQYMPLEGKKFARQISEPIDLQTIQAMIYAGWNIKKLFRLLIQSFDTMNNSTATHLIQTTSKDYFKEFYEATEILRYFQLNGNLEIGIATVDEITDPKHEKSNNKQNDVKKKEVLQIVFPSDDPKAEKFIELMGNDKSVIKLNGKYIINVGVGFQGSGKVGLLTRSTISCMYYLSQSVNVPESDSLMGKATHFSEKIEHSSWKKMIDSLMDVKFSHSKPKSAYVAIYYRDKWFYIDDCDLISKKTFSLLLQLYNWQSGRDKIQSAPLLTIPVS